MKQLNTLILPNGKFILNSIDKDDNIIMNLLNKSFDNHTIEHIDNKITNNDLYFVDKI
jgi:hypothetical protein